MCCRSYLNGPFPFYSFNTIFMKKLLYACFGFLLMSCSEKGESTSFKVWGNCGMCKKTIESCLQDMDGVISADWNTESKMMELQYDPEKVKVEDVQKAICSVGYDTEVCRGDDAAYDGLHSCCKYDRKP